MADIAEALSGAPDAAARRITELETELARLRDRQDALGVENAALDALVRYRDHSGLWHSARARHLERDIEIIRASTSWRVTWPLRLAKRVVTLARMIPYRLRRATAARQDNEASGPVPAGAHGPGRWVRHRLRLLAMARVRTRRAAELTVEYARLGPRAAPELLAPRVVIIAEITLPQCAKYRVWQKQEHLRTLGFEVTVLDWRREEECRSALQVHALALFYRTPALDGVPGLIQEAKRLGLPTYWEVDDLIFDRTLYLKNRNLLSIDRVARQEVLDGAVLFRTAMLACDRTIASTTALAQVMRQAGAGETLVIENSLDRQTLSAAEAVRVRRRPRAEGDPVVVAYGSGTRTHNADFLAATPALLALLQQCPQVRLRVIGPLDLPPALKAMDAQVEALRHVDYRKYLELLADADISIAPLEDTVFNAAKSNIKFLEAAILGVPSVCTGLVNFRQVIRDGVNGFVADDDAQWLAALRQLVDDPALRQRMGAQARHDVLAAYAPAAIAQAQVGKLVAGLDRRPARPRLRVLVVNVYFAPQSFGGATIVAEELARRLHARDDTEVFVFTSRAAKPTEESYTLTRYDHDGIPVIAVRLRPADGVLDFDNPQVAPVFADVLRAVQPDVVHFHSIQGLSASIIAPCQEQGIPYVVTLHDAWWLCMRQFMVRADDRYCFQTRIDLSLCAECVYRQPQLEPRFVMLQQALRHAAFLLSPSEAHRRLYLANGHDAARLLVNRNGVRLPTLARTRRPGDTLRLAYVGGNVAVKGFHLVRRAIARLRQSNYVLVMVDNTLNLGFGSIDTSDWSAAGTIEVVPSYTQDGMDAFFEGVDVLLFPSQWKESFGLTVREALARDVWVITTEGGGAAEDVVDGVNGTLIPLTDDPAPLHDAIAALLDAPERLAGYSNPHASVLTDYDAQAAQVFDILCAAKAGAMTAPVAALATIPAQGG